METQELVQCPYEKSHRILKHRFQIHLVKCARNHKCEPLVTCPFNVTHQMTKEELEKHVLVCTERKTLEIFRNVEEPTTSQRPAPPPMPVCASEENWDNEDAPTYNPSEYVAQAPVMRSLMGAPPSERKMFRQKERLRLLGLEK